MPSFYSKPHVVYAAPSYVVCCRTSRLRGKEKNERWRWRPTLQLWKDSWLDYSDCKEIFELRNFHSYLLRGYQRSRNKTSLPQPSSQSGNLPWSVFTKNTIAEARRALSTSAKLLLQHHNKNKLSLFNAELHDWSNLHNSYALQYEWATMQLVIICDLLLVSRGVRWYQTWT